MKKLDPTKSQATAKTRLLVRLGWSGFFVALAALGVWVGWSANKVRQRNEILVRVELGGGSVVFPSATTRKTSLRGTLPLVWQVCGAKPVWWLLLPEKGFRASEQAGIEKLFPEAHVAPVSQAPAQIR